MSKLRISAMEGHANQVAALLSAEAFRAHDALPLTEKQAGEQAEKQAGEQAGEQAEALHLAAARGHIAVVETLIAAGASVNQIFPGGSALHAAVMGNYPEVVKRLLQAGGDPNLSDRSLDPPQQGWTALMYAACYGRTEIAHQLLQAGAQPETADRDGQTPLMIAANAGHTAIALLLLEAGARITTQDHYGNTALACALGQDCESLAQSLAARAEIDLEALALPPAAPYNVIRTAKLRPWNWESAPADEDRNPSPSAAIAQMP